MDDPESPDLPLALKRQNALWGSKLLEALNPKGTCKVDAYSLTGGLRASPTNEKQKTDFSELKYPARGQE